MKHIAVLLLLLLTAAASAQDSDYPFQAQSGWTMDASVVRVDPDRDRVQVSGDDGNPYTLDTSRAAVVLLGTTRPGQTGDLVEGMRVHIAGALVSGAVVETERVNVLPFRPPTTAADNAPKAGERVFLRGTVDSVNDKKGTFNLRVGDSMRTVHMTPQTDSSAFTAKKGHVPVRENDTVQADGVLGTDGVVQAERVAPLRRMIGPARRADPDIIPALVGPVVGGSDRMRSRDIKVRDASGRDVTVHVPRGAVVVRSGKAISVHDLGREDVVRVLGVPDGEAFRASSITVTGDVRDLPAPP